PLGDEVNGGLAPALIPSRGKGAHNVLLAPARAWLPPARASSSHPFVGARAQFHGQARFQSVKLVLDLRGHPVLAARRPRRRFWRLQVVPTHPAVIRAIRSSSRGTQCFPENHTLSTRSARWKD